MQGDGRSDTKGNIAEISAFGGELEITTLNDMYLKDGNLRAELLGGGFTWFDTGTNDSMMEASNMIQLVQRNNGKVICCPEAIAYNNGWISEEELIEAGNLMKKNSYGQYLLELSQKKNENEVQKVKKLSLF